MSHSYYIRKCTHYLFINSNCKNTETIVRKRRDRSQKDLMPQLRDDSSFQYEEW